MTSQSNFQIAPRILEIKDKICGGNQVDRRLSENGGGSSENCHEALCVLGDLA